MPTIPDSSSENIYPVRSVASESNILDDHIYEEIKDPDILNNQNFPTPFSTPKFNRQLKSFGNKNKIITEQNQIIPQNNKQNNLSNNKNNTLLTRLEKQNLKQYSKESDQVYPLMSPSKPKWSDNERPCSPASTLTTLYQPSNISELSQKIFTAYQINPYYKSKHTFNSNMSDSSERSNVNDRLKNLLEDKNTHSRSPKTYRQQFSYDRHLNDSNKVYDSGHKLNDGVQHCFSMDNLDRLEKSRRQYSSENINKKYNFSRGNSKDTNHFPHNLYDSSHCFSMDTLDRIEHCYQQKGKENIRRTNKNKFQQDGIEDVSHHQMSSLGRSLGSLLSLDLDSEIANQSANKSPTYV